MGVDVAAEEPFGPYLVYERLGVGGMATVHRALERGIEGFERIVALKRLLPHLAEDASFIKSFVREAKLASLLNHVNIVQIFELGRVGTEYFISMEYIDGRDIRRVLRHARKVTGPPPIHVTVGLLLQLCEALDYAHVKTDEHGVPLGIVHRDVSPSNLLVTSAGHLKVIDFGIAKAQSQQLRTQTGRVKGKLAYMAPEALTGAALDARSDLFAAGVILHELLAARPLFARKNEYETLVKLQKGDIQPPSAFNQAVPPELDAICMRALARDPDERWRSAAEMRDALHDLRRQYNLQTGHRDVAQWLTWAFSIEAPTSTTEHSLSFDMRQVRRTPAPRPHKEDDEAVEVAWGGNEADGSGQPVVLDDVPDVSEKHRAPDITPMHGMSDAKRAFIAELEDDMPATPSRATAAQRAPTAASLMPTRIESPVARKTPVPTRATPPPFPASRETSRSIQLPLQPPKEERTYPETLDPDPDLPVRFKPPTNPPGELITARPSTLSMPTQDASSPRHKRTSDVTIGSSIIQRQSARKPWVIVVGLVAAGAAATAVTLVATRDRGDVAAVSSSDPTNAGATHAQERLFGTVKFLIEPPDATITFVEKKLDHLGSPWTTQLEPGMHQIQIQRDGYKAWLTSIELSANETQTLRVVLEPMSSTKSIATEATLTLGSTPDGLEAFVDDRKLGVTPLKAQLEPGAHTIVLRQNGKEVWRHELTAKASANYEFSPSMSEAKQRERAQRVAPVVQQRPAETAPAPTVDATPPAPPPPDAAVAVAIDKPPPAETAVAPPKPVVPVPAPTPPVVPKPTPAPPPRRAGPVVVPPTAVKRISGESPTVGKTKRAEVPPVVAAKVCIDTTGKVTTVDMITKLERLTSVDLGHAIKTWRYAPYKQAGVPTPACFVVSFRVE